MCYALWTRTLSLSRLRRIGFHVPRYRPKGTQEYGSWTRDTFAELPNTMCLGFCWIAHSDIGNRVCVATLYRPVDPRSRNSNTTGNFTRSTVRFEFRVLSRNSWSILNNNMRENDFADASRGKRYRDAAFLTDRNRSFDVSMSRSVSSWQETAKYHSTKLQPIRKSLDEGTAGFCSCYTTRTAAPLPGP